MKKEMFYIVNSEMQTVLKSKDYDHLQDVADRMSEEKDERFFVMSESDYDLTMAFRILNKAGLLNDESAYRQSPTWIKALAEEVA